MAKCIIKLVHFFFDATVFCCFSLCNAYKWSWTQKTDWFPVLTASSSLLFSFWSNRNLDFYLSTFGTKPDSGLQNLYSNTGNPSYLCHEMWFLDRHYIIDKPQRKMNQLSVEMNEKYSFLSVADFTNGVYPQFETGQSNAGE